MTTKLTRDRRDTPAGLWSRCLLAIAIAAITVTGAKAEPNERTTTGRMLLQLCNGASEDARWCDAYITGVVESMFGSKTFPSRCFKDRPQLGDMKKVIVDFASWSNLEGDEYPLRRPAPLMIQHVLTVKYCS
ncbi:MAG: Rap1a immunity protein [Xanthobacteraceae bacterium]|jgi:hypothetical protein|nr:Rap1a immunity protein [Xanthobacteraceae bacterium]